MPTNSGQGTQQNSGQLINVSGEQYLSNLAGQIDNFSVAAPQVLQNGQPGEQQGITTDYDWRARLRPKNGGRDLFWFGNDPDIKGNPDVDYMMKPLYDAGGLVWQYTPDILLSSQVNYNQQDFHGQNYPLITYKNTIPPAFPVTSDFSANTIDEARYLLGVIHFCKAATKSFFGDAAVTSGFYGTPPPVLLFEYLGHHGFNKVPVVMTSYSITYPADVDYVPVASDVLGQEVTYVPTLINMQINLQPSYTPHKLRKRFDLQAFTTGKNYKDGFV